MLPSTACNITCDTGIKRTITLAGEDIDARTLLAHVPIGRTGSPLSRGRRGFVIRPSDDTREMRRTYANLRNEVLGSRILRLPRESGGRDFIENEHIELPLKTLGGSFGTAASAASSYRGALQASGRGGVAQSVSVGGAPVPSLFSLAAQSV